MRDLMADRLRPYGASIFATIGQKAIQHQSVNLGQGFPDFDCPDYLKQAATDAMAAGHNQYAPPHGVEPLRRELADFYQRQYGLSYDPQTEITVQVGSTQAMFSTLSALTNPGDEWIVFEPTYDTYVPIIEMFGGKAVPVVLHPPTFAFDPEELKRAFTNKTRGIIVNTPHNPTGRVFSHEEMTQIADLCQTNDCLAVTDEVYEHLVFEGQHIAMASLPGMRERTITISSLAKTFSITGWKIGYCLAPPAATLAIRRMHQFIAFAVATPFQYAAAQAIRHMDQVLPPLVADLAAKRLAFGQALRDLGFSVLDPQGTFFILADFRAWSAKKDVDFVLELIEGPAGVASIPISVFYGAADRAPSQFIRFCFAKKESTLQAGLAGLKRYQGVRA
ncbi:MAG: aminotransferase class I/II-fold pyridoxal phosphate-dependent enzyme [Acidobacteria bacterium]|nr:aminotransferase class I/II-fold pyridoxal phosphate-dependent enzyme [Acidobacteriota bacterium]MCB9396803.1 aminotransferase class I/II-fold pyridoxal phosphate-dependent enzyme [Acidobacteriota bacterium]